jgi:hypothetical protein
MVSICTQLLKYNIQYQVPKGTGMTALVSVEDENRSYSGFSKPSPATPIISLAPGQSL